MTDAENKLENLIEGHVKGIYYSDVETKDPWQPFEGFPEREIKGIIDNDTYYWTQFIKENIELIKEATQ